MSVEPESQMFPRAYVEEIRKESAGYRTELRDLERKVGLEGPLEAEAPQHYVFKRGYLPPQTRVDRSQAAIYVNRFPRGDIENFSVARTCLARSQELLGKSHAWDRDAPWEKAYLEALAGLQKAQGEYVSGQDGGFLAPEEWSRTYFSLLRSFSVLDQLPITRLSVPARINHIPKVTNDVTQYYAGENATITTSAFQLGQVSYTARKASHLISVSNELIRDAADLADTVIRAESARAHAEDRDTQLLTGQGGDNPTGLITMATAGTISKYYPGASATTSISSSSGHATPSFLHVSQLRGKIHQLNSSTSVPTGQAHCNGIIAHTRFEQTVLTQNTTSSAWTDANGRPLWMSGLGRPGLSGNDEFADPGTLMGQVWALTNILPTNSTDGGGTASSFMIAGWWDMYVLFESAAFQYDTAIEPAFLNDQTLIRAIHRYDGAPAHPEAFAVLAGCDA